MDESRTPPAEERAADVGPSGIEVAYQRFGDPAAPPMLMLMGVAAQMIHWPDALCHELAGYGLHLIRFDNRDAGRSTHLWDAPSPFADIKPVGRPRCGKVQLRIDEARALVSHCLERAARRETAATAVLLQIYLGLRPTEAVIRHAAADLRALGRLLGLVPVEDSR
ncbi:MAG: hypothetical protein U1A78_36090 [Polyangia bacterium]